MEENCCNWEPPTPCCCGEPKNFKFAWIYRHTAIDPETMEQVELEVEQEFDPLKAISTEASSNGVGD